jgi:transcriptional regulator with XRE-family HTH domain
MRRNDRDVEDDDDFRERRRTGIPVAAPPGGADQLAALEARAAAGLGLWNDADGLAGAAGNPPLSAVADSRPFPARLNVLRVRACLSVADLAAAAGLGRQHVYQLLAGGREPTLGTLLALAGALRCTVSDLAGDALPPAKIAGPRECSRCGDVKPADDFPDDHDAAGGKRAWCRRCERARLAKYKGR